MQILCLIYSEERDVIMKICEILKKKDVGAIGIGAMIVFIAMVLVAGIAASVLIQTSTKLETQAMYTGQETIKEVSTGVAVYDIKGYASAVTANCSKLTITVRPRAGSDGIDFDHVFLELSETDHKIIMKYVDATANNYLDESGYDDVFGKSVFPGSDSNKDDYGILVCEDADSSISEATPILNTGDKILLCVNTQYCFNFSGSLGILERTDVWGMVAPEYGSPGVISFRTPSSYTDNVFDLQ